MKVGVLGYGTMGQYHAGALAKMERDFQVFDTDLKMALEARKAGHEFVADLDDFMESSDAVIIATPSSSHYSGFAKCMEYGRHTLVEKPLSNNLHDAKSMALLAAENPKLVTAVDHTERFNPVVKYINGVLEEIPDNAAKRISTMRFGPLFPKNKGIRRDGVVLDTGPHDIDLCRYFMRERPRSVRADLKYGGFNGGEQLEYAADITMNFSHDRSAHVALDWDAGMRVRRADITAKDRHITADLITQQVAVVKPYDSGGKKLPWEKMMRASRKAVSIVTVPQEEPLINRDSDFLGAIENGSKATVPIPEGLDIVRIIDAIKRSHGREVQIDWEV